MTLNGIMPGEAKTESEKITGGEKLTGLRKIVASYESGLIAFSGGLDSTFLLYVVHDVLQENVAALTIVSPLTPSREVEETRTLKNLIGVRHIIKEIDNLKDPCIRSNPKDRCYFCKLLIYREGVRIAKEFGLKVFMDGTTAEDRKSGRPGLRAIDELGVKTPLAEAGFTRHDIRLLSREFNLPTWDKPSQSCLATRIPYGIELDADILKKLDACELIAEKLGFSQVRARLHENILRLEFPPEEFKLLEDPVIRKELIDGCKELGVSFVTIDLEGFSSGSMDKV